MKRLILTSLMALAVVIGGTGPSSAQMFPTGLMPSWLSTDSAVRVGLLFGTHEALFSEADQVTFADPFRIGFDPKLPILQGMCELTFHPNVSARLAGATSIIESRMAIVHPTGIHLPGLSPWDVDPAYIYGEAAALYHLWSGGGYRFSVLGGYRRDQWNYYGEPAGNQNPDSRTRDEFGSDIPFLGMQTAFFSPWWKARFEVLASPFMNTHTYMSIRDNEGEVTYKGQASDGGFIEFEMEGNVAVSSNIRLGLYGKYSYQEVYGSYERENDSPVDRSDNLYVGQSFATIALDLGVVF